MYIYQDGRFIGTFINMLNVNGLHTPIKRQKLQFESKSKTQLYAISLKGTEKSAGRCYHGSSIERLIHQNK